MPAAVGRTAVAVGGMTEWRVVYRLTRTRMWIGVLAALLVGIVALNVMALSFNASSSRSAALADQLRSENSALTTQIADGLSNERLQRAAARLGLVVPEPGSIRYLDPQPGDAAKAASRLRSGALTFGSATTVTAPVVVPVEPVPVTDAAVAPAAPVPAEAAPLDPVAPAPSAPLAAPASTAATADGGVSMP